MPTWTKKDYEMVARTLRDSPISDGERDILVQAFANRFAGDNPLFDRSRFDAAVFRGEIYRGSTARHGGWTRQDYVAVAEILRGSIVSDAARAVVAQTFADRFYYDNPNFKSNLFYRAALGPDYETRAFMWPSPSTVIGGSPRRRPQVRVQSHRRAR